MWTNELGDVIHNVQKNPPTQTSQDQKHILTITYRHQKIVNKVHAMYSKMDINT